MKTTAFTTGLLLAVLGLTNCVKEPQEDREVMGLKPIYMTPSELMDVRTQGPQTMRNPGKIYYKDNFIFVNEKGVGVHILNNADPSNPVNVGFIKIPGNGDVAIKNNLLYADNGPHLIVVDIADPSNVQVVSRTNNVFPPRNFPAEVNVAFECVDHEQGVVIGWEEALLINPKCNR